MAFGASLLTALVVLPEHAQGAGSRPASVGELPPVEEKPAAAAPPPAAPQQSLDASWVEPAPAPSTAPAPATAPVPSAAEVGPAAPATASAPASPTQPVPVASTQGEPLAVAAEPSVVQRDYERAKQLMLGGSFAEATQLFEQVAREATDVADKRAASELAGICRKWQRAGVRVVRSSRGGAEAQRDVFGQDGRLRRSTDEIATLYINAVLYGLGSGAALAVLTEPDDPAGFFLPTFAITGAAVGAVAIADQGEGLRYGVPQSISSGMYIGLGQGVIWSIWQNAQARGGDEWEEAQVASVVWASATAGAIAGGVIGETAGTTPGRAGWVGSTTLWGGVVGALTVGGLMDLENDSSADENTLLGAAVGTTGGAVAGLVTASDVSPTIGRVRFIDLGGLVGSLAGMGLYSSAAGDNSEPRGFFWATNIGTCAGLATAWVATSRMEHDYGDDAKSREQARMAGGGLSLALETARPTLVPTQGGMQLGLTGQL